jgi:hypothetical protein
LPNQQSRLQQRKVRQRHRSERNHTGPNPVWEWVRCEVTFVAREMLRPVRSSEPGSWAKALTEFRDRSVDQK